MRSSEARAGPALDLVDAVARRVRDRAVPVRFRIAESPAEREAAYRLRYETVIAEGWAEPGDLPDGLERDAYDEAGVHVVGWDGDRLAAVARLVFPREGQRLPTEEAFDVEVEPRGEIVDLSRLVVARPYRDRRQRAFAGLLGSCWLEIRARGFSRFCAIHTAPMLRLYRRMGFETTRLAPPRRYWNDERYPVRFELAESARALSRVWSGPRESMDAAG